MADRTVSIGLVAKVSGFVAGIKTSQAALSSFNKSLEESARKQQALRELGNAAGVMGAAAAAGFLVVVKAAADFEQAMSHVQAATHETAGNMKLLRQAALDFGQSTQYSATEAAGAIEELAKAGVSTADILHGGLEGALNLAAAGGLAVADAAEAAASAMTQFGLSGASVPHIADLLAAGAGKAQGSVADLGMALNQAGLVANQTGLSIEETTGGLAAFASAGLTGSDAGTSFKTMLQSLTPRSQQAAAEMAKLNIQAYDQQGNFVGLAKYAGMLQDGLKGLSQEQQAAALKTIFGSDAVRAASVLYKDGADGIQAWIDKTNDSGYAAQTAAIRMDNLSGDLEQLKGALETALIGTGDSGLAPLRELVQIVTSLVNAYNDVPGPVKNVVLALGVLTAAIGLSVFAATRAVTAYTEFNANLATLGLRATTASGGLGALNKRAIVASVGVTALVTGAVLLAGANNDLIATIDTLNDSLGDTSGFDTQNQSMEDLSSRIADMTKARDDFSLSTFGAQNIKNFFTPPWMDSDLEKAQKALEAAQAAQDSYKQSLSDLTNVVEGNTVFTDYSDDVKKLQETAELARPVLEGLGFDLDEILQMKAAPDNGILNALGGIQFQVAAENLRDYNKVQDSIPGRAKSVADAVGDMGDRMKSASQKADGLRKSLDALLGPQLGLSEATDAWTTALRHLDGDLAKHNKALTGNTDAAIKNRAAIRDRVTAMTDVLVAEAKAGATSDELSSKLKAQRKALIDAGAAAGISRDDMRDYLDQLGLTPHLVKTVIKADTGPATSALRYLKADLAGLHDLTFSIDYYTHHYSDPRLGDPARQASGGRISGPGGPRDDRVPAMLSNGEFVVNAAATSRHLGLLHQINRQQFALGGRVGPVRMASGGEVGDEESPEKIAREITRAIMSAVRGFNVGGKQTARETRSELHDLISVLKKTLGKDSPVVDRVSALGDRLLDMAKRQDAATEAYGKATDKLDSLKQAAADFARTVASAWTHDAFSSGGLDDSMLQLRADRNDARRVAKDIALARKHGLDGALLKQIVASGNYELLDDLAHASRSEIEKYEDVYRQTGRITRQIGQTSSDAIYGKQIRQQIRVTEKLEHVMTRLDKRIEHMESRIERGAERGVREGISQRERKTTLARRGR